MEEPVEEHRVIPELYFLIAKFLSGGPLKETAKTLLKELESVEVLPPRLDWEGAEHTQTFDELASRYSDLPWDRLVAVCSRALRTAQSVTPATASALTAASEVSQPTSASTIERGMRVLARLSLLSDSLVRERPTRAWHIPDHTLVRRLVTRELGSHPSCVAGGRGGHAMLAPRMLSGLKLQRRTLGHLSAVYCLVFDCTGRYVITGADDLLVKVWSALDGRLICTLRGAGAEITDVCVSRDGSLLAAGSVERLVRVWALSSGAPTAVLSAHQGTITAVHWSPGVVGETRWLASTSTDGSVAFWTASRDGRFLSQPVQYVERMRPGACHMICAAWSAGGAFLAAGSADHHVRIYQLPAGNGPPRRVLETAVHSDAVDSLAWARSGLRLVSGSKDGSAAVWALHATQWRHQLLRCEPLGASDGRRLKVTMVCWDCSDQFVLTAVSDNTIRVWCARTCSLVRSLSGHRDEAYVLEPHPTLPGVVLSAGHDGQLFVWHAPTGETIASFHNEISGQGDGALFDAKWGGPATVAASDSHGHLLLLGLGDGHPRLKQLPNELFFHTDYRPLVRDALGGALDEQTSTPPHLMPPPFLVDVEGAPHPPQLQRLVPGREQLALDQLVPAADARSRLDMMIEVLAGERTPPPAGHAWVVGLGNLAGAAGGVGGGVWRGEGVRHTLGSWHSGEPAAACTRPLVASLSDAHVREIDLTSTELNAWEQAWWRREMRRRPLMISTGDGARRRPGRRPARPHARHVHASRPPQEPRPQSRARAPLAASPSPSLSTSTASSGSASGTSDSSLRLSPSRSRSPSHTSGSERPTNRNRVTGRASGRAGAGGRRAASRARPRPRQRRRDDTRDEDKSSDSDSSVSYSDSKTEESSGSSSCSDWEAGAGAALAPPVRARRRPIRPTIRYSPSVGTAKRTAVGSPAAAGSPARPQRPPHPQEGSPPSPAAPQPSAPPPAPSLAEAYRPGEWLSAVSPRKAPYHPQMGDHCLYFRLGHQRYFEAVAEKDVYRINPRDKPWDRAHVYECELVKVVGIKYVIKPPRVVCLRLACSTEAVANGNTGSGDRQRSLTVRYHDMADVIDFLVLKQQFDAATSRNWGPGDRFRCMIDDSWWTGVVVERVSQPSPEAGTSQAGTSQAGTSQAGTSNGGLANGGSSGLPKVEAWAANAASHFLSLKVRWDNGEVERLSPWDLEPIDTSRLPSEPGGAVPVLAHELEAVLYRAEAEEWPPGGERAEACATIAQHIQQVMSLAVAEPFVAPVDLQLYPSYAMVVPYPVDLATIKARFDNLFYRRAAAAQFDVRCLASNAERFNRPHSPIVRQARLVTDLLLHIISHWRDVDVVGRYHELAASYQSSDDEPLAARAKPKSRGTRRAPPPPAPTPGSSTGAGSWEREAERLLLSLVACADAEPFRSPVSPDQAPDYHLVVSTPMDLGTCLTKLTTGQYRRPAQLLRDARLVFANSRAYNTNKRSRIYSMTVRLSALFESLWARSGLGKAKAGRGRGARGGGSRTSRRSTREPRPNRSARLRHRHSEDSSESEPLAVTSRRVHATSAAGAGAGPCAGAAAAAAAGAGDDHRSAGRRDSWDSDEPLHVHSKGKGVGKRSRPLPAARAPASPEAGPSAQPDRALPELPVANGSATAFGDPHLADGSSTLDSDECQIEVLEEELFDEEVQLSYSPAWTPTEEATRPRKRRRRSSSASPASPAAHPRRRRSKTPATPKRTRERFPSGSWSSSSSSDSNDAGAGSGGAAAVRYESDRSYKPRYSTDDDQPLNTYRQRQTDSETAGPSGSAGPSRPRASNRHVSLRARSPRRYNEDSEEDSAAAISKRQLHHRRNTGSHDEMRARRHRHAQQTLGGAMSTRAHDGDHDYFNGHAMLNGRSGRMASPPPLAPPPVSISSRGRVRKLTAKARELRRE